MKRTWKPPLPCDMVCPDCRLALPRGTELHECGHVAPAVPRVTTHHIETGPPGYSDIAHGRPFTIMPNVDGIHPGDLLNVEVVKHRGYSTKTLRRELHRIRAVMPDGAVVCDPRSLPFPPPDRSPGNG